MVACNSLIDALMFDFDGTVVETELAAHEAWVRFCNEKGIPLPQALRTWIAGSGLPDPSEEVLQILLAAGKFARRDHIIQEHFCKWQDIVRARGPRPGVEEFISAADQRGIQKWIVTNNYGELVENWLRILLPNVKWKGIISFSDILHNPKLKKPAPFLYQRAIALSGAARAIAIEDSPTGVQAGLDAGLPVILVRSEITKNERFPTGAIIEFPSLMEAIGIL